jgi:hypothetical protein
MQPKKPSVLLVWLAVAVLGLAATPGSGLGINRANMDGGSGNPPPFDFQDSFYMANGISPAAIVARVSGAGATADGSVVDNSNTDPNRNNIRVVSTTGGFNNSGSLIYYSIFGFVMPNTFTNDAAGQNARNIADSFRAFIFPKASAGSILSPAPGNRRQDNVFDTRNGYFSNNPLGLWILKFVIFTPQAFTSEGQAILAPIAASNGTDLDGTPILKTADLIDNLAAQGLVSLVNRPLDGSRGFPWVI